MPSYVRYTDIASGVVKKAFVDKELSLADLAKSLNLTGNYKDVTVVIDGDPILKPYVEYVLDGNIRRTFFSEDSGESLEDAADRYRSTEGVGEVRIVQADDPNHISRSAVRNDQEEVRRLGIEASELLRDMQQLDLSLAGMHGIHKSESTRVMRVAIIKTRDDLARRRRSLLDKQRTILKTIQIAERSRLIGDQPSLTQAVREIARRVGAHEHLYFALIEHLDDDSFDWRTSVRRAQSTLGPEAAKQQSPDKDDPLDALMRIDDVLVRWQSVVMEGDAVIDEIAAIVEPFTRDRHQPVTL